MWAFADVQEVGNEFLRVMNIIYIFIDLDIRRRDRVREVRQFGTSAK